MIKPDAFTEHYNSVYDQVKHLEQKPYGCLQWKGTNACIDVYCSCGNRMHFDEWFLYYILCSKCDTAFALAGHIKLIPLNETQRAYVEDKCPGVLHKDGEV